MKAQPGARLRDDVAALLRLKFIHVRTEHRLATTTADVFYTDDTSPIFPRTIAVEAKDWKSAVTSSDIASIYNLYAPSIINREIDDLLIIGRKPLAGSPNTTIGNFPRVRYLTFDEFRSLLMNFENLIQNNIFVYQNSEEARNFIPTRVSNSDDLLFDHINNWLTGAGRVSVVFGGYGAGKTTFSLHLASRLSEAYLDDRRRRIPIRITLGGLYSKQDLVSLICSTLSGQEAGIQVKDFSYGLFLEMNRAGQFILILDGFDEMKHAMDIFDFSYTFEQMKPLFSGNAKVVILGRPDAFFTNEEEDIVFNAAFDSSGDMRSNLRKIEIAFFSKSEIDNYIASSLRSRGVALSQEQQRRLDQIIKLLPEGDNILSRPVQARMFTRIIEDFLEENRSLTRYNLFHKFIYGFLGRESQKLARQPRHGNIDNIPTRDDRMAFMQSIAWWIISQKKENRFIPEEVPIDIIPLTLRRGRDTRDAIRESIVGSVIEPIRHSDVLGQKGGRYYYFPHKSYIEFLVAEYFSSQNTFSKERYREFLANSNNEIVSFIEEGPTSGIARLREGLEYAIGPVDRRIVEVCSKDPEIIEAVRSDIFSIRRSSQIYPEYLHLLDSEQNATAYLSRRITEGRLTDALAATFNCCAHHISRTGDKRIAAALFINIFTSASPHALDKFGTSGETINIYRFDPDTMKLIALDRCFYYRKNTNSIILNVSGLFQLAEQSSKGALFVRLEERKTRQPHIALGIDDLIGQMNGDFSLRLRRIIERPGSSERIIFAGLMGEIRDQFQ